MKNSKKSNLDQGPYDFYSSCSVSSSGLQCCSVRSSAMGCNSMAFLTLSEAAGIVGVNKATLWRAIKQGRLSAHRAADKSYRIEESELLRVFPDAGKQHTSDSDSLALPEHATLRIDTFKAQVEQLQRQLEDMQRDKQWLMQQIETLEATQQRLLPPPRQGIIERMAEAIARLRRPKGTA